MDIIEVKYVDYGNVGQVPLASLRKPKPHYLALPAQSVDCRLANLKPAGSVSSSNSKVQSAEVKVFLFDYRCGAADQLS